MKEKKDKVFVLDTNVFIHRAEAALSFRNTEVVVPLSVLEELDNLKKGSDEKGRNARVAIRFLDELSHKGSLSEGVKMENGSLLRVLSYRDLSGKIPLDLNKADNRILAAAVALHEQGRLVFFVSKDINARVKAMALGLKAVDYTKQTVNINELYAGWRETELKEEAFAEIKGEKTLEWNDALKPNEFLLMKNRESQETLLARHSENGLLQILPSKKSSVFGIKPLNDIQKMAFDLLLDDSIPLVSLVGKAGTGKTLLAIAAGLRKVLEEGRYSKVLVSRPVVPMGKDIGYLPGAKDEKMSHWMQPVFDNLEYIFSTNKKKKENDEGMDSLLKAKLIEVEALTYIRGRSLPEQYIIIDEAQNLSPHEIKTIVSRAGKKTKVVLTGDPYQIDSPYLDTSSNGLSYLVESFKGQPIFGHVTLNQSERSPLAELAAELL